jgi:hypothetical protein
VYLLLTYVGPAAAAAVVVVLLLLQIRESGVPAVVVRPCALTEEPAGAPLELDQGDVIKVCGLWAPSGGRLRMGAGPSWGH